MHMCIRADTWTHGVVHAHTMIALPFSLIPLPRPAPYAHTSIPRDTITALTRHVRLLKVLTFGKSVQLKVVADR